MEARHTQKYLHTSPRKLRLVADLIRKIQPIKALDVLEFTTKAASIEMSKAVKTALGNAKQLGMDQAATSFKTLSVEESLKMKRFRAGTRGRAKPYKRRMAHIKIVLSDQIALDSKKKESRVKEQELVKKVEPVKSKKGEKS